MAITESDLVVEDGTGLPTANTYVSLTEATAYHTLRGNEIWTDSDENDQCIALVRASQYIDQRWTFKSIAFDGAQGLQFPRAVLFNRNGTDVSETVPVEIEDAAMEYALQVLGDGTGLSSLSPTPDQTDPRSMTYNREKVGSLETEVHYDSAQGLRLKKSYPTADTIITRSRFASNGGGGVIR